MASIIHSPAFQSMALSISSALLTAGVNRIYSSEDDKTIHVFGNFITTTLVMDYFIYKGVELAGKFFTLQRTIIILAILGGNCAYVALRLFFSGESKPNNEQIKEQKKTVNKLPELTSVNSNNETKKIIYSIQDIGPRDHGMFVFKHNFIGALIEELKNNNSPIFEPSNNETFTVRFLFYKVLYQPNEFEELTEDKLKGKPRYTILFLYQGKGLTQDDLKIIKAKKFITQYFCIAGGDDKDKCGLSKLNREIDIPRIVKDLLTPESNVYIDNLK